MADDERVALARELPVSLRIVLDRAAYAGDFDRDEFFARVARHGALDRGRALEYAEVVCRALATALPWETLTRLRKDLGPPIAPLLAEPEAPDDRDGRASFGFDHGFGSPGQSPSRE